MSAHLLSELKSTKVKFLESLKREGAHNPRSASARALAEGAMILERSLRDLQRKLGRSLKRGRAISSNLRKEVEAVSDTVSKAGAIAFGLMLKHKGSHQNLQSIVQMAVQIRHFLSCFSAAGP